MKKTVLALGLVMALSLVSVASAATVADLQTQVNALMAEIAAMGGTASVASNVPTITSNLTLGSTGSQVVDLQKYLEDEGYLVMPVGVDYGYFGKLTQSAVAKWQAANGVSPASGYFGPISREALDALRVASPISGEVVGTLPAGCTAATGFSSLTGVSCAAAALPAGCTSSAGFSITTGVKCDTAVAGSASGITTIGAEGDINIERLSSPSNAKLNEGESGLKVAGFSVEAVDSDVSIQSAKITFEAGTTAGTESKYPWKYFDSIMLYAGDTKVGEVSASSKDDWTEDGSTNIYSVRFANINTVVKKDQKVNLYVVADALSTIDSGNLDRVWSVDILANDLRVVDGAGLSQYNDDVADRTFTVEGVTDATLTIKTSSLSPDAYIQAVSSTTDTLAVTVLKFGVKAANTNVDLTEVVINLASSTAIADVGNMIGNVELYQGSTLVASDNVTAGGVATFDLTDEGVSIAKDATETFTVKVDINALGGNYLDGNGITASVVSVTGEDSEGTEVSDTSGVTGDEITFSISAATVTTSWAVVPNAGNLIDFKFVVTAEDEDFTVLSSSIASSTSGTATTGLGVLSKIAGTATDVTPGAEYTVASGDTATFQVRYSITGANGDYANVTITEVAGQAVPDDKQLSPTASLNVAA